MVNKIYKLDINNQETEELFFTSTQAPVISLYFPLNSKDKDVSDGIVYVNTNFDGSTLSVLSRANSNDSYSVLKKSGTESEQTFSQSNFFGDLLAGFVRQGSLKFKVNNPTINTLILVRVSIL